MKKKNTKNSTDENFLLVNIDFFFFPLLESAVDSARIEIQ